MFNSKYTGEEIEAMLDKMASGAMFEKTEAVASSTTFENSFIAIKVKNLVANRYVYLCFNDSRKTMVQLGNAPDSTGTIRMSYNVGDNQMEMTTTLPASHIGVGSIINITLALNETDGDIPLLGIAFCDRAYLSWTTIPEKYKQTFA